MKPSTNIFTQTLVVMFICSYIYLLYYKYTCLNLF